MVKALIFKSDIEDIIVGNYVQYSGLSKVHTTRTYPHFFVLLLCLWSVETVNTLKMTVFECEMIDVLLKSMIYLTVVLQG